MCSLPERIRPTVLAFGGVADGFVPFDAQTEDGKQGESQQVELQMASIVMKAVQVHVLMLLQVHRCTLIVTAGSANEHQVHVTQVHVTQVHVTQVSSC